MDYPRCANCGYEEDDLTTDSLCYSCYNSYDNGWREAMDLVLGVIREMNTAPDFDAFTLDELEQRII